MSLSNVNKVGHDYLENVVDDDNASQEKKLNIVLGYKNTCLCLKDFRRVLVVVAPGLSRSLPGYNKTG